MTVIFHVASARASVSISGAIDSQDYSCCKTQGKKRKLATSRLPASLHFSTHCSFLKLEAASADSVLSGAQSTTYPYVCDVLIGPKITASSWVLLQFCLLNSVRSGRLFDSLACMHRVRLSRGCAFLERTILLAQRPSLGSLPSRCAMGERQYSGECGAVCLKVDRAHMTHFQLAYWYVSSHSSCKPTSNSQIPLQV